MFQYRCFNSSNEHHDVDDDQHNNIRIDNNNNDQLLLDSPFRTTNLSVIVESITPDHHYDDDNDDDDISDNDYDDLIPLSPHVSEPSLPPLYIYRNDIIYNEEYNQLQEKVLNKHHHDVISNSKSEDKSSPPMTLSSNIEENVVDNKKKKYNEIINCLNGCSDDDDSGNDDNGIVNLWKLRELSLSYGGLLCPTLRKRAWPILTQLHCDVFMNTLPTTSPLVSSSISLSSHNTTHNNRMIIPSISIHDTHLMKKDLKMIKYVNETYYDDDLYDDVDDTNNEQPFIQTKKEDIITKQKSHQVSLYNVIVMTLEQKLASTKRNNSSNSSTSPTIPTTNTTAAAKYNIIDIHMDHHNQEAAISEQDDDDFVVISSSNSSICSSIGNDSIQTINSSMVSDGCNTNNEKTNNKLYVSSYRYYEGLIDITNVLYTNLQSASLTTLLLTKLVKHHLRDAFRPSRMIQHSEDITSLKPIETAVMLLFIPLLRNVDIDTYNELIVNACHIYHPNGLVGGIETSSGVIAKHVSTWFCNAFYDCSNKRTNNHKRRTSTEDMMIVSSRIADVCIASHPLMSIYIAVAILTIRKKYNNLLCKWNNKQDFHIQIENLFYLDTITNDGEKLEDIVEQIIDTAIHYMKLISTKSLLEIATATSSTTCTSNLTTTKKIKNNSSTSQYNNNNNNNKLKYRNITLLRELHSPKWCTSHYAPTEYTLLQWKKNDTTSLSMPRSDDCNPYLHYPKAYCVSGVIRTLSSSILKNKCNRVVFSNKNKITTLSQDTIMFGISNSTGGDFALSKSVTFLDKPTFRRASWKHVLRSKLFVLLFICTIILFVSLDVGKIDKLQITRQLSTRCMSAFSRDSLEKYSYMLRSALPTESVTNAVKTMQIKSSLLFHSVSSGTTLSTFSQILENGLDSTKMGYKKITNYEYHNQLIEIVNISRTNARSLFHDADFSIRSFVNHSRVSILNRENVLSIVSVTVDVIPHRPIFMNNITNSFIEFQKTSSHYIERIENITHVRLLSKAISPIILSLSQQQQQQNIKMKNTAVVNHTSLKRRRQKQSIKNQVSSNIPIKSAVVITRKDLANVVSLKPETPEIQFGKKSLNGMYYYLFIF